MRRLVVGCFLAGCLLASLSATAQAPKAEEPKPSTATSVPGLRGEILAELAEAEQKLVALAEATPADKLTWRPAAGVRSTVEAYLHVAQGNYFLPTFWGVKPPETVTNLRELDKSTTDKAKAIELLKASFGHLRKAIETASEAEFEKSIDMFGQKTTIRGALLTTAVHAHEHLGQAIAYARMSGIAPPWSRGQD